MPILIIYSLTLTHYKTSHLLYSMKEVKTPLCREELCCCMSLATRMHCGFTITLTTLLLCRALKTIVRCHSPWIFCFCFFLFVIGFLAALELSKQARLASQGAPVFCLSCLSNIERQAHIMASF